MSERWASFDCYGTLVDWQGGMRAALEPVLGARAPEILASYHRLEPVVQRERFRPYREVLAETLRRAAAEHGIALRGARSAVLSETLPWWPVFADTGPALRALRADGWRIAILSNIDRDLIERTLPRLGGAVDEVVTAEDVQAYKPDLAHFRTFAERTGARPGRWVHVACSLVHDVAPTATLGVPSVWIDRDREGPDPRPAATLTGLTRLAATLRALVPGTPAPA